MFFSKIGSNTASAYFRWYLNNSKSLSHVYVSGHNVDHSWSGMVTLELAVGDTVSLQSIESNKYGYSLSCYTIIKIKQNCVYLDNDVNKVIYKEQQCYMLVILFLFLLYVINTYLKQNQIRNHKMKVDHHKFLFCIYIMVYCITFKQRTVHICLQRILLIACLIILY